MNIRIGDMIVPKTKELFVWDDRLDAADDTVSWGDRLLVLQLVNPKRPKRLYDFCFVLTPSGKCGWVRLDDCRIVT